MKQKYSIFIYDLSFLKNFFSLIFNHLQKSFSKSQKIGQFFRSIFLNFAKSQKKAINKPPLLAAPYIYIY